MPDESGNPPDERELPDHVKKYFHDRKIYDLTPLDLWPKTREFFATSDADDMGTLNRIGEALEADRPHGDEQEDDPTAAPSLPAYIFSVH